MKWVKCILALILLLGSVVPEEAAADRGRRGRHGGARIGLYVGVPYYLGWHSSYYPYPPGFYASPYYPYPPYYTYPPVVVVPPSPPVYIERDVDDSASSQEGSYWYYCDRPAGYYPDVKECADGWQRVAPRSSR